MNNFRSICSAALLLAAVFASLLADAQVAVKTNLLYDATTTPNLGLEIGTGTKTTLDIVYGLNPWNFKEGKKVKHWLAQPGVRFWLCNAFSGSFFGIHAMGGQYNFGNVDVKMPACFFGGDNMLKSVKDTRMQGWFAGGGISYGYQWIFSRHLNFEAEIGVGYTHIWYDQYPCANCGSRIKKGETNYIGPTKAGLSLIYLF